MTAIEWYYARGNKQNGPVNSAELKRLATAGELVSDDLVWREGLTEWAPARSVRGLFEPDSKPATAEETPAKPVVASPKEVALLVAPRTAKRHPVDALLDWLRARFDARFVETTAKVFRACGLYGLLVAMAVLVVFAVIVASKTNSLSEVPSVISIVLLLGALQYVAGKFCAVLDDINRTNDSTLPSQVLPDSIALLSLVSALFVSLGAVTDALQTSLYVMILPGVASFFIFGCLGFSALNLSTLSVSITTEPRRVSDEAINILAFLVKLFVRLVPVMLGLGVIAGTLTVGCACYQAMSGEVAAQISFSVGSSLLLTFAALPLAVYLLVLLYSLLLDLCRAVLGLSKPPKE